METVNKDYSKSLSQQLGGITSDMKRLANGDKEWYQMKQESDGNGRWNTYTRTVVESKEVYQVGAWTLIYNTSIKYGSK